MHSIFPFWKRGDFTGRAPAVEAPAVVAAQPAPRRGGRFPELPVGVKYVVRITLILPGEWDVLAKPRVVRRLPVRVYAEADVLDVIAYRRSVFYGFASASLSLDTFVQVLPVLKEAYHRVRLSNGLFTFSIISDGFANRGKRAERIRMHLFRMLDI